MSYLIKRRENYESNTIRDTTYSTIQGKQVFNYLTQVLSNYIEHKFGKQEIKKKKRQEIQNAGGLAAKLEAK